MLLGQNFSQNNLFMEALLNKYIILFIIFNLLQNSCSIKKDTNYLKNNHVVLYKKYLIASFISEYNKDSIWHDMIPCIMPDDLDKEASIEIDSLVKLSYKKLWEASDAGREFVGSRDGLILDDVCVAEELLKVYNSKDLEKLANAFAERKKKKLTIKKH